MRRTFGILTAVALCVSVPLSGGAATTHVERKDYVGSYDPLSPGDCLEHDGKGVGVVCLPVRSGDISVEIVARDSANPEPGFFYILVDANGDCAGTEDPATGACSSGGFGCPRRTGIGIPSRARTLKVYPSGAVIGPLQCVVLNNRTSPGTATTGTITATFRN